MIQSHSALAPTPTIERPLEDRIMPPEEAFGLGALSTAVAVEFDDRSEEVSLLNLFQFSSENKVHTVRVVEAANEDPRIHKANHMLHDLANKGGKYKEFAQEVLGHQRDVAELAVASALESGITDEEVLMDLALAGLSHDAAKGQEDRDPQGNLAAVFMHPGKWSPAMREIGEKHPQIAAHVQDSVGLSRLVQYLTDWHHRFLRENPDRHIKQGGYGGNSVIPSADEREHYEKLACIFTVSDDVAAGLRRRVYTEAMAPIEAVNRTAGNLIHTEGIEHALGVFAKAAGVQLVA